MLKRSIAVLTCATVLALVVAPTAGAQDPDLKSYGAGASATALVLELLGQSATFSATSAAVGSKPQAAANGQAAVVPPLFSTPGAPVQSTGALVEGEDCVLNEELPPPLNLLGLEIACVRTAAAVSGGSPEASSISGEIEIDIISAELLAQVTDDLLRPLLTQLLDDVIGPILTQIGAIPGVGVLVPSLDRLVTLVLADLSDGGSVARVTVAPTSSLADKVNGLAGSQGAVVEVLPGLLPGITLAEVTVGDSSASASYDEDTGEIVTDGEAAFLQVDLAGLEIILGALLTSVGDALAVELADVVGAEIAALAAGLITTLEDLILGLDDEVEDLVNQTVDQLACPDSPLAAVLCFEAGTVHELDAAGLEAYGFDAFGAGTKGIESTLLGLNVLDGTLELGIGQTAAGANAVPATPSTPNTPDAPTPDTNLPRTGGNPSVPLAMALFAAATVGISIVRRTRTV